MRPRLPLPCAAAGTACVLALAACGDDGASGAATGTSTAASPASTARAGTPPAPRLSALLSQVPESRVALRRLAGVDLARVRELADASPVYGRAQAATLDGSARRVLAAMGPAAAQAVVSGTTLVVAGPGAAEATPEVVPVAGGREVASGNGRLVVGPATRELLAGTPRTPVISRREVALAQLCTGDAVAELVLGPGEPGLGGDASAGVAVVPQQGVAGDPEVVVCSVPGLGTPFKDIEAPLERGLRRAGLERLGAIAETEDDSTERVVLSARVKPTAKALALLGDPAALKLAVGVRR